MPHAARKGATPSRASDPPRLDLPRETRLVRRAEYDAVYREGRRRSSREFTLFVRPNGLDVSRFGWSIKKALGNAVKRNRIRRRMREIFTIAPTGDRGGMGHRGASANDGGYGGICGVAQEMIKLMLTCRSAPNAATKPCRSDGVSVRPAESLPENFSGECGRVAGAVSAAGHGCCCLWCSFIRFFFRRFLVGPANFIPRARRYGRKRLRCMELGAGAGWR